MNTDARIKELLDKIYSDDEIAETIHELGDPSLLELAADEADSSAGNDASADNADDYEREAREILRRITATPAGRTPRLVIVRKAGYWAAAAITLLLIAVAAWRFAERQAFLMPTLNMPKSPPPMARPRRSGWPTALQ